MPLVNIDAKGLELYTCGYLTQDPTLCWELRNKVDVHDAQRVLHKLGEGKQGRLIAKIFNFRMIFGGTAYAYYKDPDFAVCGYPIERWQQIIDDTYRKYPLIPATHERWMYNVRTTGKNVIEQTGREYVYKKYLKERTGEWQWPFNAIVNHPVQGLGADLVSIARVSLARRMAALGLRSLLISTVHDSILVDCPDDEVEIVVQLAHEVFADIPKNFERIFGYEFNLPMFCECKVGYDYKNMLDKAPKA